MKCPKCGSTDTKKVSVIDAKWRVGHERCKSCDFQADWGLFMTPPLVIGAAREASTMVKGFSAYETIGVGFPNLNLGGHDVATARRLVSEGKMRWALCLGGVLSLVPVDYELRDHEHFLVETFPNRFEEAPKKIDPGCFQNGGARRQ